MTQVLDPMVLAQIIEATRASLRAEILHAPDGPLLRDVWKEWLRLRQKEADRVDSQQCHYHGPLILDLEFDFDGQRLRLGDVPVNRLTLPMGKAWHSVLKLAPKRTPKGGPTSPTYRDRIVTTLQSVVRWVVERSPSLFPLQAHPLHGWVREGGSGRKRTGCFENEGQLDEYCRHMPPWLRPIVRLAAGPGCMRLSEVLYLEKSEIVWSSCRIALPARSPVDGCWRTKNREARDFPISKVALEDLAVIAAASPSPRYVFSQSSGRRWSKRYVQHLIQRASQKSGLRLGKKGEVPTFHYLRRTGLTWRLIKDGDQVSAMAEGGWKTPSVMHGYADQTAEMVASSARMADVSVADAMKQRLGGLRADTRANPIAATPRRRSSRRPG